MSDKKKKKEKHEPESDDSSGEETFESYFNDDESPSLGGAVGEGIKKLFAAGLSAAFLTEESIRSYLQDVKLPKEVISLFLQGAAKSKEQLMNRVGNEVIQIIQKIDFVKEASRFVETHKFRVSAEIEVIKKDKSEESTGTYSFDLESKK